jgi:hypothetical protein
MIALAEAYRIVDSQSAILKSSAICIETVHTETALSAEGLDIVQV